MEAAIQALAEPRRREILQLVRDRELTVGEIAAQFDVSRPAISQHLKVLREAGLVSDRREGTRRYFRAEPRGFVELRAFLEGFWDSRLEMIKTAAEAEARERVESGDARTRVESGDALPRGGLGDGGEQDDE